MKALTWVVMKVMMRVSRLVDNSANEWEFESETVLAAMMVAVLVDFAENLSDE